MYLLSGFQTIWGVEAVSLGFRNLTEAFSLRLTQVDGPFLSLAFGFRAGGLSDIHTCTSLFVPLIYIYIYTHTYRCTHTYIHVYMYVEGNKSYAVNLKMPLSPKFSTRSPEPKGLRWVGLEPIVDFVLGKFAAGSLRASNL